MSNSASGRIAGEERWTSFDDTAESTVSRREVKHNTFGLIVIITPGRLIIPHYSTKLKNGNHCINVIDIFIKLINVNSRLII
jgi:hypothetical protein